MDDLKDCMNVVKSRPYPALQADERRAEKYREIREHDDENLRRFRALQENQARKNKGKDAIDSN